MATQGPSATAHSGRFAGSAPEGVSDKFGDIAGRVAPAEGSAPNPSPDVDSAHLRWVKCRFDHRSIVNAPSRPRNLTSMALKTPEQLLAYKPLKRVLAAKAAGAHAVAPNTSILEALRLMASKEIGFLVVLDGTNLVGVVSERDYARKVVLQGKASSDTPVQDIMTRDVVSVGLAPHDPRMHGADEPARGSPPPGHRQRGRDRRALRPRSPEGNRRAPRAGDPQSRSGKADVVEPARFPLLKTSTRTASAPRRGRRCRGRRASE